MACNLGKFHAVLWVDVEYRDYQRYKSISMSLEYRIRAVLSTYIVRLVRVDVRATACETDDTYALAEGTR